MYIDLNKNDSHQQKTTFTVLYIQREKDLKHLYTQKNLDTLHNSKTICVTFLFTKIQTFQVMQFFIKSLKLAFIYIQKASHFSFCESLLNKKSDTLKKARQFVLRCFLYKKALSVRLYIQKSRHFTSHCFFKTKALCATFYM